MAIKIAGTEVINDDKELVLAKLAEVDATIADTAVDVFVYDTRKDSDGGAWRKRTQHTSWYNETLNTATRGARREFPAVAVIVAKYGDLIIYDGDDPSLPMWMVFPNTNDTPNMIAYDAELSSCFMLNGVLTTGIGVYAGGLTRINFISEEGFRHRASNSYPLSDAGGLTIATRANAYIYNPISEGNIVNDRVNDVAMTVLPNAPIDSATGLPVPTIAVATDGGVSVIKDDGTVMSTSASTSVKSIDKVGEFWFATCQGAGAVGTYYPIGETLPSGSSHLNTSWSASIYTNTVPPSFAGNGVASNDYPVMGSNSGISQFNYTTEINDPSTLVNNITSSYNTGWMNGNIKLATLSDTDDTDVTGTELVTNGDFSDGGTGWTVGSEATVDFSGNSAHIASTLNTSGISRYPESTVTGPCIITFTISSYVSGNAGRIQWRDNAPAWVGFNFTEAGTYSVMSPNGIYAGLPFSVAGYNSSFEYTIDNISVRLAEEDRSVNGNGLQVFGTVTKTPVATGADLVAYSGFSPSNYLQQPYNSDLDFGTGDFCVMGWFKENSLNNLAYIFARDTETTSVNYWMYLQNGQLTFKMDDGTNYLLQASGASVAGRWQHVVGVRDGNTAYLYVNGVNVASLDVTALGSLTNTSAILRFGLSNARLSPLTGGSLALWRISATAPTAEQIKKIYEDEKVLFQDGAQATLYGSSDAVTALAYDEDTSLLHVGSSSGRSVFSGLRRVDNTTDAVGSAISASNGMVVED